MPNKYTYSLTEARTIKVLDDILKSFDDDKKPILMGGMAVAVYLIDAGLDVIKYRKTEDIDLLAKEKDIIYIKSIVYRINDIKKIIERKIFGKDGIEIIYENGPKVSILFSNEEIPYEDLEIKIGKRKIKVRVARLEWLLVDKIFTYLNRKEEKDLMDVFTLLTLAMKHGINEELLSNIFEKYSNKYKKHAKTAKEYICGLFNYLSSRIHHSSASSQHLHFCSPHGGTSSYYP